MTYSAKNQLPPTYLVPNIPQKMDVLEMLRTKAPEYDYVMPGMIGGTVGALISQGGVGKSWIALEVAVAVAGGPDLLALDIEKTGRVVYLPAEDPSQALHHRMNAISGYLSEEEMAAFAPNFDIYPLADMLEPVDILRNPHWMEALEPVCAGARMVIIDTLRRFHQEDENDGNVMTEVIGKLEYLAKKTGTGILYLHHASKAATLSGGGGDQTASRGSSVLTDNAKGGVWNMLLMSEAEARSKNIDPSERRSYTRLTQSKCSFGPLAEDRWLQRSEGGVLIPANLNKQSSESSTSKKARANA